MNTDRYRRSAAQAKAGVDIARIIGETLPLKRQGRLYVGICPFHADGKTPSFTVYPDHYYCFGCGARGDVIDWLTDQRDMTFSDALAYLGAPPSGLQAKPPPRLIKPQKTSDHVALAQDIWNTALDPPIRSPPITCEAVTVSNCRPSR